MRTDFDIAIVGSGFAGSLLAMIARRLGRSVVLLERGTHPRFAIGESSTPLANLLLEELARRYGLADVLPLCKWGTWQQAHPQIGCGLKRGFSFFHHEFGQPFAADEERTNELLVAASPHDAIADTHWYRPEFDQFLVEQAQALGVEFLDRTSLTLLTCDESGARLAARRGTASFEIHARFLIDASGPRGFLHRARQLTEAPFADLPPTQALFAHFAGVARWDELHPSAERPPYPPDDAAVHHIFDGGWIWMLRFNNGLTSAGAAVTDRLAKELALHECAPAWKRLLARLPTLREHFAHAEPATPFGHLPRVAFRASQAAGPGWVLLPSAAGVVDPLLSTGFPLTLLGIERLATLIERDWASTRWPVGLANLGARTLSELDATASLIAALYANLRDFEIFAALTLLYFAAASFAESARRLHRPKLAPSFLLAEDERFGPALRACCHAALHVHGAADRAALLQRIAETIEPFDVAGLGKHERRRWFPACAEDFLEAAHKLSATRTEAAQALARTGFTAVPQRADQEK